MNRTLAALLPPEERPSDPFAGFTGAGARAASLCARLGELGAAPGVLLFGGGGAELRGGLEQDFSPLRVAPWPASGPEFAAPDRAFHTVVASGLLHQLEEPGLALWEAWRVLEPGGTLLIRDLHRPENEKHLEELVHRHAEESARDTVATCLRAALTPEEVRMEALVLRLFDVEVVVDDELQMSLQCAARPESER